MRAYTDNMMYANMSYSHYRHSKVHTIYFYYTCECEHEHIYSDIYWLYNQ